MQLAITERSTQFSTCPQIQPEDVAGIAALGFKTIMNNRPDHEGGSAQPTSAAIAAIAQQMGLTYIHIPITPGQMSPADIAQCSAQLSKAPTPILGFCKSGVRANLLYEIASQTHPKA